MNRNLKIRFALALAIVIVAAIFAAPKLLAQFMKAPDTYTVVENTVMSGPGSTTTVYRDGQKALVEIKNAQGQHTRTLYDLQAHTDLSWSAENASAGCGTGTFSGDWGDPFASSADMTKGLSDPNVKMTGAETINGFATKVYEITGPTPAQSAKAWVDNKYGLVIKANVGAMGTMVEVKQLSVAKPAASVFFLPSSCAAAAAAGPPKTEAQQMAIDTGIKNTADYSDAGMPPTSPSTSACTVNFKVVRADTMAPITAVTGMGLDLDQNSNGSYTVGGGANGSHYSGGTIKDVTAQYRNGILRIDNAPPHFRLDVEFKNGDMSALVYRQCFQPQTTLLLVLKNPDNTAEGKPYWLWSKTGK
jgi:hypothetical protein